jgi:hypothetical protein
MIGTSLGLVNFGLGGIQRIIVQLLGQLDETKFHWKKHAKR